MVGLYVAKCVRAITPFLNISPLRPSASVAGLHISVEVKSLRQRLAFQRYFYVDAPIFALIWEFGGVQLPRRAWWWVCAVLIVGEACDTAFFASIRIGAVLPVTLANPGCVLTVTLEALPAAHHIISGAPLTADQHIHAGRGWLTHSKAANPRADKKLAARGMVLISSTTTVTIRKT